MMKKRESTIKYRWFKKGKISKIRKIRKGLSVLLAATLIISSNVSAMTLDDEKKDYEDSQNTAEAQQNTADKLVEDIQEVNEQIAVLAQEIESANAGIEAIDKDIELSEEEILEIEESIAGRRDELSQMLSVMYESTLSQDQMSVLMRANDTGDLLVREEYINSLTTYIENQVTELEELEETKFDKNDDLLRLKEEREDDLEVLEEKKALLGEQLGQLGELVQEAQKKADNAQELADSLRTKVLELEAKERQILSGKSYNGESSDIVYDGDGTDYYYVDPYDYTDDELTMLAGIIECEAGSVSYPGMIAVGSVVMNRVESPNFSNTIEGVIYAPYQFEPVSTGTYAVVLARGPNSNCYMAAQEVLEGKRNVPNYYFKAAWYAEEHGISGVNIGGNVFH